MNDENILACFQKKLHVVNNSNSKINNIVCVKFNSNIMKEKVMRAKKSLKSKPVVFDYDDNESISYKCFINHSLTTHKRIIHKEALKTKSEKQIKFIWIRESREYFFEKR